jgi:hypothetical protein
MTKYLIDRFLPFYNWPCVNRIHDTSILNPIRGYLRKLFLMHYQRSGINISLIYVNILAESLDLATAVIVVVITESLYHLLLKIGARHFHLRDPRLINLKSFPLLIEVWAPDLLL